MWLNENSNWVVMSLFKSEFVIQMRGGLWMCSKCDTGNWVTLPPQLQVWTRSIAGRGSQFVGTHNIWQPGDQLCWHTTHTTQAARWSCSNVKSPHSFLANFLSLALSFSRLALVNSVCLRIWIGGTLRHELPNSVLHQFTVFTEK